VSGRDRGLGILVVNLDGGQLASFRLVRICENFSSFSGYLTKMIIAINAASAGSRSIAALIAKMALSGWIGLGLAALAAM
jgi:chloramphenicol 3-O-phosphotransferase